MYKILRELKLFDSFLLEYLSDGQMDTVQLPTSHSQRLNSGKPLGTGGCEHLYCVQ